MCHVVYKKREVVSEQKPTPTHHIKQLQINAKHVEHASDVHFHEDFYMFNKHNTFSPEKKNPRGFVALGLDD